MKHGERKVKRTSATWAEPLKAHHPSPSLTNQPSEVAGQSAIRLTTTSSVDQILHLVTYIAIGGTSTTCNSSPCLEAHARHHQAPRHQYTNITDQPHPPPTTGYNQESIIHNSKIKNGRLTSRPSTHLSPQPVHRPHRRRQPK